MSIFRFPSNSPLADLPRSYIPDANILLSAFFIRSLSLYALLRLPDHGFSPIITSEIKDEALAQIRKVQTKHGLTCNLEHLFEYNLEIYNIRVKDCPLSQPLDYINKNDQHVARAALHLGSWILTNDTDLILETQKANIQSRLPWDLIEHQLALGRQMTMEDVFVTRPIKQTSGTIYIRFIPHWSGTGTYIATLTEIEGLGKLWLDGTHSRCVMSLENGHEISIKIPITHFSTHIIGFGYSHDASVNKTKLTLGGNNGPIQDFCTKRISGFICDNVGKQSVGHSLKNNEHINGSIKSFVMGPTSLSKSKMKALFGIPNASPNPFDTDTLSDAILNLGMELQHSGISVEEYVSKAKLHAAIRGSVIY